MASALSLFQQSGFKMEALWDPGPLLWQQDAINHMDHAI